MKSINERRKRSLALFTIITLLHSSSALARDLWLFWFEGTNSVLDEMYSSEIDCKNAQDNWQKEPTMPLIIFRCAKVSPGLLEIAKADCAAQKYLACKWASNIETHLSIIKQQPTDR